MNPRQLVRRARPQRIKANHHARRIAENELRGEDNRNSGHNGAGGIIELQDRLGGPIDAAGGQRNQKRAVMPVTNWLAARVRGTIGNGSTLGGMATHYLYDTTLRTPNPMSVLRSAYANPWVFRQTNMDGLIVDQHVGLDVGITTRSQWGAGIGGRYITPRYDDRETRGGIAYRLYRTWEGRQWWNTDPRPAMRGGSWGSLSSQNGGHRATGSVWLTWWVTPSVSLSLTTTARLVVGVPRWADTETDAAGQDHCVFGRQDARIFDNMLRARLALSRRATIDLYTQLLVGTVRCGNYQEQERHLPAHGLPARGAATSGKTNDAAVRVTRLRLLGNGGKQDSEGAAASRLGDGHEVSTELTDDAMYDRDAEPGALANLLGLDLFSARASASAHGSSLRTRSSALFSKNGDDPVSSMIALGVHTAVQPVANNARLLIVNC